MATTNIGTGKINDNSMVFRLDYGEHSALFTGDIYTLAEGHILDTVDNAKLDVDFLKIPHHGWNTSSSAEFVKAVSAKLAVATSFLEMEEQIRRNYVSAKTEVLLDVYDGYIHVSAGADGTMDYETSR
jgi:competence protein ComEC